MNATRTEFSCKLCENWFANPGQGGAGPAFKLEVGRGEGPELHCVVDALDIYKSFYYVIRQPSWRVKNQRIHFSKFAAPDISTKDDNADIPLIAASWTCKWCCKWTTCEHTALLAYVFSPAYTTSAAQKD
jgi:hypothetical protein